MRAFFFILFAYCLLPILCFSQDIEDIACKEQSRAEGMDALPSLRNYAADQTNMIYQEIHWNLDPAVNYISGVITYHFLSRIDNLTQLVLDLDTTMHVNSVRRGIVDLAYTHTDDLLLNIDLGHSLNTNDLDSLTISYEGAPHSTGFGSFELGMHNTKPILWAQSVPYGVRDWWPGKQDLIDKIDSIDVYITTPEGQLAAGNGKLMSITSDNGKLIHHWRHRYPIVSYLVSTAITNYESYSEYVTFPNGDSIHILNYVYPESKTQAQSMTPVAKEMMKYYIERFGPYPYAKEKFGHAQFSWGGGTEIQTMNFMTNFSTSLISHELAHQWFGDMVTCGSYSDTWLNEGFATYCTGLTYEQFPTYGSFNNWKTSTRSDVVSEPDGSVYVADTADYARIFDSRLTYNKGAYVLHMLRWVVGDSNFFDGCKNYLHLPHTEYGFGRTRDLQNELEAISGMDLDEFFEDWYYGEGYPSYILDWRQTGDSVRFWLSQTPSHSSVDFFEMPVPVSINYAGGSQQFILNHTNQGQEFNFEVGNHNISSVLIDPDKWLLSKNNTIHEIMTSTFDIKSGNHSQVYPNPASSFLSIKSDIPITHVKLTDALGVTRDLPLQEGHVELDNLPSGMYTLILFSKGDEPAGIHRVVINR